MIKMAPSRRWFLFLCMLNLVGCLPRHPSPPPSIEETAVGQGERFETGLTVYDEYFSTVHQLHGEVVNAERQETDAISTLASVLDLLPTAPAAQVLRKLRERLPTLPAMELVTHDPIQGKPPSATVRLVHRGWPKENVKSMMLVLEASANANLDIAWRMKEIPERCQRMSDVGKELIHTVEHDFAREPMERRDQIRREFEASFQILVGMAASAEEIHQRTQGFTKDLEQALTVSGSGIE